MALSAGAITPTVRYQKGQLHAMVTDHQGTPREIFTEKGIASWAGASIHGVKWRFGSLTTVEPTMTQIIPNAIFVLPGNMKTAKRACIITAFGTRIRTAGSLFHQIE
ncbi:hypothetical protein ACU7RR_000728 [Providencia stuartii]|uniref:Rhs family protein n=1 Tax=Providencia stuartii (strain MRSN 2154) TaxID=1157951 RepID=A0A140SST0_PROSM|nr:MULTISPECIES: hypothetical protein [Providencia]AFH95406.1 Rhs family protein [Providencia stuartii MRSN 2154]MDE8745289.1 hypothetical protein [Providencia thailandensis]MDE8764479.1 hypothetical protein [Providencia thailandensis]MDE8776983.1 hypothetical protein [Providencia thailandensis]MDE8780972.1 hypothetical protein [Providencia thailandensis]